jgi:hypothetical protein
MSTAVHLDESFDPGFWYVLDRDIAHRSGLAISRPPAPGIVIDISRSTLLAAMRESMAWRRAHEDRDSLVGTERMQGIDVRCRERIRVQTGSSDRPASRLELHAGHRCWRHRYRIRYRDSSEYGHGRCWTCRRGFGLWDGSRLPTSTEPVAIGSHAEPRPTAHNGRPVRTMGTRFAHCDALRIKRRPCRSAATTVVVQLAGGSGATSCQP